jgi:hypothetical protein
MGVYKKTPWSYKSTAEVVHLCSRAPTFTVTRSTLPLALTMAKATLEPPSMPFLNSSSKMEAGAKLHTYLLLPTPSARETTPILL